MTSNIVDFGADPTGVNDSTTAIQDALDNGDGLVEIPAGTFRCDGSPLVISQPLKLFGAGSEIIQANKPASGLVRNVSGDVIQVNANDAILEDFGIYGQTAGRTTGSAIVVGADTAAFTGATITVGQNVATVPGVTFVAGDIGKSFMMLGAGLGGDQLSGTITAVSGNQATLNVTASATIGGAGTNGRYGYIRRGVNIRGVSTGYKHERGIWLQSASGYHVRECRLWAEDYGFDVDNFMNPDGGDGYCEANSFNTSDPNGVALRMRAGGSLKIQNNTFGLCRDSIEIDWVRGKSGGPYIVGNKFENFSRYSLYAHGVRALHGVIYAANFSNGGTGGIHIADDIPIESLVIGGASEMNSGSGWLVRVGAGVNKFSVGDMLMNGQGGANGVYVHSSAANGRITTKAIFNCPTGIQNNSGNNVVVV